MVTLFSRRVLLGAMFLFFSSTVDAFTSTPFGMVRPTVVGTAKQTATTPLTMIGTGEEAIPSTFREAEVLGLKLMQEEKYEEALKGTKINSLSAFNDEGYSE